MQAQTCLLSLTFAKPSRMTVCLQAVLDALDCRDLPDDDQVYCRVMGRCAVCLALHDFTYSNGMSGCQTSDNYGDLIHCLKRPSRISRAQSCSEVRSSGVERGNRAKHAAAALTAVGCA